MRPTTPARLLLLTAVIVWGFTFVATKICLAWLSPTQVFGLRLALAVPTLYLLLRLRGIPLRRPRVVRPLLLGSALFAAHFLIQINGLRFTTATNTGWIISITPLVMALLARLLLGERLRRVTLLGIAVATLGILLLVSHGRLASLDWLRSIGDWLVLATTVTWALYTIAIRDLARSENPLLVTFWILLAPAALMAAIAGASLDVSTLRAMSGAGWVALVFLGVPGMALAHWFWQEGVARVGAAEAGVFLYLEPVATTALAVPYLGEPFGPATLGGGMLVLAGVWIAGRRPRVVAGC